MFDQIPVNKSWCAQAELAAGSVGARSEENGEFEDAGPIKSGGIDGKQLDGDFLLGMSFIPPNISGCLYLYVYRIRGIYDIDIYYIYHAVHILYIHMYMHIIFELLLMTGILPYISCLPSPGCISTVISGQLFSAACLPACCWLACWLVACELASLPDWPSLLGLDCLLVCLPACLLICLPFWLKVCQWEMLQCSFQSASVLFVMSAKHGVPCKRHRAMTSPFSRGAVCLRVLLPWALLQWLYAPVVLLFSMSRNSIMCQ